MPTPAATPRIRKSKASLARSSPEINRIESKDRAVHDWYRFVLSYPPHVVREYLERFKIGKEQTVLDPFCGTGTTVVECKKLGIASLGIEAHPFSCFAAQTKVEWSVDACALEHCANEIAEATHARLETQGVVDDPQRSFLFNEEPEFRSLGEEQFKLLLTNSISPRPLHKVLMLRDEIERRAPADLERALRLALAREISLSIGNLHFGPEVGVGPAKADASVVGPWLARVRQFASDLRIMRDRAGVKSEVTHADSRKVLATLEPNSVDAVITSPPYPNEKDYTRTTRLESVLMGFINTKSELQELKRGMLMRSNTRNVYKGDKDDYWVKDHAEVQRIAVAIEARRIELGKTSGFERLYARVTKLYFGGMARHLAELRTVLRPGAQLAYVVGDQASYLRIMIRTGQILASVAEDLGYEVIDIDLFRTRLATATGEQLREEVVVLRWPGAR